MALQLHAQNLVTNGDFENGFIGWNNLSAGTSVAAYSLENTAPYAGASSMKAIVTTAGTNAWDAQSLGPTLALSVGAQYTLTFHAKGQAANTNIRMVLQNSSFLGRNFSLSTSWARYSWTFTAAEASPRLKMHHFEAGTFWIDNISVVAGNPLTLTIRPEIRHQEMTGFGGALTWNCDRVVSSPHSAAIKQLLFQDLGLDAIRLKNWYYPTNYPANKSPLVMGNKSLFNASKTLFDEAKAANPDVKVLLSSWSPPASLKSNGSLLNGGTLTRNANGYMYDEFAQYWVDVLDNLGWSPDYLSFQNEPGYVATWESCVFRPTETLQNAGYAQAADAIHNAIKDRPGAPMMIGAESENIGTSSWSDWKNGVQVNTFREMNTPLLSRPYIRAHAYHVYNMYDESQIDGAIPALNMVRGEFQDRPNFMTEFSKSEFSWLESARAIHNTLVEANTSAYFHWKLVWSVSADSMIGISSSGEYTVGPHYHMLKHYSRHVNAGHRRIEVSGSNTNVRISGFINPAGTQITMVAINKSASPEEVAFSHDSLPVSGCAAYQSVVGNFHQNIGSINIANTQILPAESMTTYVLSLSSTLNGVNPALLRLIDPNLAGGVFSVKIPRQEGIRYSLWKSPDMQDGSWIKVISATQTVVGETVVFTDPGAGAPPQFYRVAAEP